MKINYRAYVIPIGIALIKLLIPFIAIYPQYELHRDEYLYLAEGRHLVWGFEEAPPLLPFLGWISYVAGNSFFTVRIWGALLGALTALVLGAMVYRLGGKWLAQLIAGLCFLLSAYLRIHILFQPNILDVFFWSLIAYALVCFFQTQNNRWLYVAGVALGLGILSKYMIVVFVLSIFAGILFTRQRQLLKNKHLWLSMLLALVIALPNIIWQFTHGIPAIHHVEELQKTQLKFISPFKFLIQQLLLTANSFPVWIAGLLVFALHPDYRSFRVFVWAYITMLIIFTLTGGKDYYTLGFYPLLFAAGSIWFERVTLHRWWPAILLLVLVIGLEIYSLPIDLPFMAPRRAAEFYSKHHFEKFGVLEWEDGKNHALPQDYADMLGWKEMTEKTVAFYNGLSDTLKKSTAIYCYNYGEAGALLFFTKGKDLPEPLSRSSSFELWFPKKIPASSLIVISDDGAPESSERYRMEDVRLIDSVSNPLAREFGTKIYFVGSLKYLGK